MHFESSLKAVLIFKGFTLLLAVFFRSFATVHYRLMATSALFAELKQFKAICLGNTHTQTHTLTDYSNPCNAPLTARLISHNVMISTSYIMTQRTVQCIFFIRVVV